MKTEAKFNKTMSPKPFMKITEVSEYTGISRNSIRQGCINNIIPHIKSGNAYMIDMEQFIPMLHELASHRNGEVVYRTEGRPELGLLA